MSSEKEVPITTEQLERLGLRREAVRAHESLDWPADQVAEGTGVAKAAVFTALTFLPVGSPLAVQLGLRLARSIERPDVVEVSADWPLVARVDTGEIQSDPDDPGTLYLANGTARLQARGGLDAVLSLQAGRLALLDCSGSAALAPEALPPPPPWWREGGDTWVSREAESQLLRGSSFGNAVAAGVYERLHEPTPEQQKAVVAAALAGRLVGESVRVRQWTRSLTPAQVETLEELALAAGERWFEGAEHLDPPRPRDPAWIDGLCELCHARDDLECALVVLRAAGAGRRLASVLEAIDRRGALIESQCRGVELDDERLRRVLVGQPWAWWAQPARLVDVE